MRARGVQGVFIPGGFIVQHDYEKLGAFYLGREVDPDSGDVTADLVLYDSKDLTTHGVIIGMTGSGKTGLGIGLLEEAAMDRIPVLAVDPKGDLANLLLTFSDLAPADFRPWINEDVARQKGLDPDVFAAAEAQSWRKGLADWGQDGERIRRLREHAEFTVYTPGSAAGTPVSVLRSFDAPPPALVEDGDAFRDRIQSTVTGLLGLLGLDADPLRSREHILLSSILDHAWRQGRDLDLGALIQAIQQPAFTRLGVMELETVYPAKDRFALAMQLNALIASPGFQGWMEGQPLDIAAMLYTPAGKPRLAIFSIAHLSDAERMFFVTMLLSAVISWMRGQAGTTSLRALLYMDEIFGFFPPVANPPSKGPMLTLLKQARAYGVGVVLASQNPVDLDYKGLGNTGTWFIGRLQTERDKARVLDALDGAMAGSNAMPRAELDRTISGLGKRVFLMHNVHRGAPKLMTTRWAMSYLAGPLTLNQLRSLAATAPVGASERGGSAAGSVAAEGLSGRAAATPPAAEHPAPGLDVPAASVAGERAGAPSGSGARPLLPPGIRQLFVPPFARAVDMMYRPSLLAMVEVRYASVRHGVDETRTLTLLTPLAEGPIPFSPDRTTMAELTVDGLETEPLAGGVFAPLPPAATQARSYEQWGRDMARWVQAAQPLTLWRSNTHKVCSRVGESERDFRMRLADLGRESRDAHAERLRQKYEPRFRTLQERLRRAEQAVERRTGQSRQALLNTGLSVLGAVLGASAGKGKGAKGGLLGAFLGGSAAKAQTTMRSAGRAAQTRQDVSHAAETVEAVQAQIGALESEFEAELRRLEDAADAEAPLEDVVLRPTLTGITVRLTALAWLPWGTDGTGAPIPLWR